MSRRARAREGAIEAKHFASFSGPEEDESDGEGDTTDLESICPGCNGSGQGYCEGLLCWTCGGSGDDTKPRG